MVERPQRFTDLEITDAMQAFGGGFVAGLGRLFHLADPDNQARLKGAFPEYWAEYDDPLLHDRLLMRRGRR